MMVPKIVGVVGMVPKDLEKSQKRLKIRGKTETIQSRALLKIC